MKKFIFVLIVLLNKNVFAGAEVLSCVGSIDTYEQFTISFELSTKKGSVEFRTFDTSLQKCISSQTCSINEYEIKSDEPEIRLHKSDLTLTTERGTFFIPKWKSKEKALFNQKPITVIRAEDVYERSDPFALTSLCVLI